MRRARRRAASGSGPYTFHNLRRSIQNTNHWLHDHARDAPRHALEEATHTTFLGSPHRLQEHARYSFPYTPYDALGAARGGRSHILAFRGASTSVALPAEATQGLNASSLAAILASPTPATSDQTA